MGKGGCTAAGRAARSKAQGQPDLSEGCVRRDDAYKVFILIRFLLGPNKMRRRHLESVSSRSLALGRSWGAAPSVFWYGAPGGSQGPPGKGGAAERWRVVYPIGIATRYGAKPATTRAYKSRPPPGRRTGFAPCKISAPPKATTNWLRRKREIKLSHSIYRQSLRHGCAVPPPFTQGRLSPPGGRKSSRETNLYSQ